MINDKGVRHSIVKIFLFVCLVMIYYCCFLVIFAILKTKYTTVYFESYANLKLSHLTTLPIASLSNGAMKVSGTLYHNQGVFSQQGKV